MLGVRGASDDCFQLGARRKLVITTADEKLRLTAMLKEGVVVDAFFGCNRQGNGDQIRDARIGAAGFQPSRSAKGNPSKNNWEMIFAFQPAERAANVILLSAAVVMDALAAACPSEIEPQHRKAKRVQRFHGLEDD